MGDNCYFHDNSNKTRDYSIIYTKLKHKSYIDDIPERYKRRDYIIDKLNCKKKTVNKY